MIIDDFKVPIIKKGISTVSSLKNEFINKKIILFGVPGAFTPTCSEKHLPGYIKLYKSFKKKKINDIYCLSVNDEHVMKSWLVSYTDGENINGIADGNAEITTHFDLISDKTKNYMGFRCRRFAMLIENNVITNKFIENEGEFKVSSAEYVLKKI
tara:strand:+ start:1281 stop:1745 length:465 start_codon:yes stop_codon:yes gene_type:complete